MVVALCLGRVPHSIATLRHVIQEPGIVWFEREGRLEALPCRQILTPLEEINPILTVVAQPFLGRRFAALQAQSQYHKPTQPPHTALPPNSTIGRCREKKKRNVLRVPAYPSLFHASHPRRRLIDTSRTGTIISRSGQVYPCPKDCHVHRVDRSHGILGPISRPADCDRGPSAALLVSTVERSKRF